MFLGGVFEYSKCNSCFILLMMHRMHTLLSTTLKNAILQMLLPHFPNTKTCILCYPQAFPGHKGPVSCLAFRQGTAELFSGSFDRSIKIWNAEDRTYISTLFGHQSEVLTIDSLRKERVLTVARDRTMHLWKVIQTF